MLQWNHWISLECIQSNSNFLPSITLFSFLHEGKHWLEIQGVNNSSSSPAAFFHWRNPVLGKQQQTGCPALNRIKCCFFSHLIPLETFTLRPCGRWNTWLSKLVNPDACRELRWLSGTQSPETSSSVTAVWTVEISTPQKVKD